MRLREPRGGGLAVAVRGRVVVVRPWRQKQLGDGGWNVVGGVGYTTADKRGRHGGWRRNGGGGCRSVRSR